MRKISLFILILFISNCGYTPIYNSDNKTKIKINIISIEGDKKINNLLVTDIKRISRNDFEKEFDIKIDTNFDKLITAKDSKGVASNYELKVVTKFEIVKPNENKLFFISHCERSTFDPKEILKTFRGIVGSICPIKSVSKQTKKRIFFIYKLKTVV